MDTDLSTLPRVIRELHQRRQLVDSAIAALESLGRDTTPDYRPPRKRGRKSMSPEDREEVSKRMRKYWAGRRGAAAAAAS